MLIVSIFGNDAVVLGHQATIAGLIDLLGAVAVNSALLAIMQKIAEMEKRVANEPYRL